MSESSRSTTSGLSPAEMQRYARHLSIPEFGIEGQRKLKAASILCIGAGGLGSPLSMYLAAAGVGKLGIVDADVVDASNLQRQLLHGTKDIGRRKIDSGAERLADINPEVDVETHGVLFKADNAMDLARPYDILIDGTDNFATRYLSNDVSVLLKKPNVYGSIFRFEGQASVFAPHLGGPCYRCMFPTPPEPGLVPSCAEGGVLGVLPGIIGMIQAIEAIKLIAGIGDSLVGRLLHFDALSMRFRDFKLRRDPECPICGENPTITGLIDYEHFCGLRSADAAPEPAIPEISVAALKQKMDAGDSFTLVDVREAFERGICVLPESVHIPLGELDDRHTELPAGGEIIVHCKSGGRSAQAVERLRHRGFSNVRNLAGGIDAWGEEIDGSIARY